MDQNRAVHFRWLGVAGVELTYQNQILAIDPFFTRPSFRHVLWGRPRTNILLAAEKLPVCHHILVSHPHYDHLMDAPAIALRSGAALYGSANTWRIASLLGLPDDQNHQVSAGDHLRLGDFQVDIFSIEHMRTPVDRWINGPLPEGLQPPLRLRDYRMDCCFAFLIQVGGLRILFNKQPLPADFLLFAPLRAMESYTKLLQSVQPRAVIPIHWDNFFRPLHKSLRPLPRLPDFLWPGLKSQIPAEFKRYVEGMYPGMKVHIPELFKPVELEKLL